MVQTAFKSPCVVQHVSESRPIIQLGARYVLADSKERPFALHSPKEAHTHNVGLRHYRTPIPRALLFRDQSTLYIGTYIVWSTCTAVVMSHRGHELPGSFLLWWSCPSLLQSILKSISSIRSSWRKLLLASSRVFLHFISPLLIGWSWSLLCDV